MKYCIKITWKFDLINHQFTFSNLLCIVFEVFSIMQSNHSFKKEKSESWTLKKELFLVRASDSCTNLLGRAMDSELGFRSRASSTLSNKGSVWSEIEGNVVAEEIPLANCSESYKDYKQTCRTTCLIPVSSCRRWRECRFHLLDFKRLRLQPCQQQHCLTLFTYILDFING